MGVSYAAYTVIGIKLSKKELETKFQEKTRCCKHKENNSAFCPECGKLMWKIKTFNYVEKKLNKLLDCYSLRYAPDTDYCNYYIGEVIGKYESEGKPTKAFNIIPAMEVIKILKTKTTAMLVDLNMPENKSFGIHTVLFCSY